jgi:hypothetical protein
MDDGRRATGDGRWAMASNDYRSPLTGVWRNDRGAKLVNLQYLLSFIIPLV